MLETVGTKLSSLFYRIKLALKLFPVKFTPTTDPELILEEMRKGNWDHVLGFDIDQFTADVSTEEEYRRKLEKAREEREEECAQSEKNLQRVMGAISEAYGSLVTHEKRTIFYIKRTTDELFGRFEINDDNLRRQVIEKLRRRFTADECNMLDRRNKKDAKRKIKDGMLEDSGLDVGIFLSKRGDPEDSLSFLRTAVRLKPNDALANHWYGSTLCNLGRHEQAIPYLVVAAEKRKSANDEAWLGFALGKLRRWTDALPYLRNAATKRGSAHDDYWLGMCLYRLGLAFDALPHLREAVRKEPNNPAYRSAFDAVDAQYGRIASALGC